jgi:hypothetical protein
MPHSADQRSRGGTKKGRRILGTAGTGHSTFIVGKGKGTRGKGAFEKPCGAHDRRGRLRTYYSMNNDSAACCKKNDSAAGMKLLEHKVRPRDAGAEA